MTELTKREYLRKIAPDFSVLEMLEQAYYQNQLSRFSESDVRQKIFYYPTNTSKVLYRAMFLFDSAETNDNKYFKNDNTNFVYEVYNYGDRFVAIAIIMDRLFTGNTLPTSGISVNDNFSPVFGVGF